MKLISVFLLLLLFFSKQQAELPKDTSRRTSILSPFGFSNPMDMHTWISRWIGRPFSGRTIRALILQKWNLIMSRLAFYGWGLMATCVCAVDKFVYSIKMHSSRPESDFKMLSLLAVNRSKGGKPQLQFRVRLKEKFSSSEE